MGGLARNRFATGCTSTIARVRRTIFARKIKLLAGFKTINVLKSLKKVQHIVAIVLCSMTSCEGFVTPLPEHRNYEMPALRHGASVGALWAVCCPR